ncbi:hypothetical protein B4Q13_22275, partial [Lacticaseibacillus rhamnosus]
RSTEESKALNRVNGPAVIISSSGMMTAGRILHHLKHRLPNPTSTVVLGGFMAEGTRGRQLQDHARFIRIHGQDVAVRAAIEAGPGLSGHADRSGLLRWLKPLPPPKQVFLVHIVIFVSPYASVCVGYPCQMARNLPGRFTAAGAALTQAWLLSVTLITTFPLACPVSR